MTATESDFAREFESVALKLGPSGLARFGGAEMAGFVAQALRDSNSESLRVRRLPAETVLWIIVGMGLFRNMSVHAVMRHLGLYLGRDGQAPPVASAVTQARQQLTSAPVRQIFEELGIAWGHEAASRDRYRQLAVYMLDGTSLSVPDHIDNARAFGRPVSSRGGEAGYPKVRVVVLAGARSRVLVDAAVGPYGGKGNGEASLANSMWDGVPDDSVLLFDRGFVDFGRMEVFARTGSNHHFVTRAPTRARYETVRSLGRGDSIIEIQIAARHRRRDPSVGPTLTLRRIQYKIPGFPAGTIWTTMLDPKEYPREEVVSLYHERWQIELQFRDIKVTQLQREEALRSQTPEGVLQEVWGVLLAYQLVRKKMFDVAVKIDIPPTRLGFKGCLASVWIFCAATAWAGDAALLPALVGMLDGAIAAQVMPVRQPRKSYPRHVKVKMTNYRRNPGRSARHGPDE